MSAELIAYRQNRVNGLINAYRTNINRLYSIAVANIANIQKSRISMQSKQTQINNLIANYNTNAKILLDNTNKNIAVIKNYIPPALKINKKKSALLIGINYIGTESELNGCINDANSIKERISKKGFQNINMLTDLTPSKPTKENILKEFTALLSTAQEGDLLFFLYSGHGSYTLDKSGDENTLYDQLIIPCDFNAIVDDELKQIIQRNLKKNVTLFAMFDSCFSGSVLDLKYQYMDSLNYDKFTENEKQLETNGNVFMISGCSDYQTSADSMINNKANGAMTWSFNEALKQKDNCSWRELVKSMRDLLKTSQYEQIPQFSSGLFENIDGQVFI
jgi:metacaspase-1